MKVVCFQVKEKPNQVKLGILDQALIKVFDLPIQTSQQGVLALVDIQARGGSTPPFIEEIPLDKVELLAPIPRPRRNIFCVGLNYKPHAKEFTQSGFDAGKSTGSNDLPSDPIIFSKVPETVVGPYDKVRLPNPEVSQSIDYEAELAVIIGKTCKNLRVEDAMDAVWGYTIINDITARDWQHRHKQWHMGKSFDDFCPMGPAAVIKESIDGQNLSIRCWVNGELRQDSRTSELIFDIPTLISTLSAGITLLPGDIIATGTPVGVGIGFQPPKFLRAGDRVKVAVEGIGEIENELILTSN
jgi:2-keto-4-pentenoate hydratase/2-oxohepta-3-ene-1,7-dioic acid hydratase in catechol pathway